MGRYILISLLAFMFFGCGGSSEPAKKGVKTQLKGVAVDDLIVNGIVKAYAANNLTNILATGRTDSVDGSYTLNIIYDGVVIVKVTCDSASQMKNPANGSTKPCISGLALRSATAVTPTGGSIKVNTSLISELMVRQMNENGTTKQNLENAQNNIGLMFGFDPVATSPVENVLYSKTIGAIHNMTDDNRTILDVIDDINADLKDGQAGDDGNISAKLAQSMRDVGISNNLTQTNGNYTPPANAAPLSDIAQSKTFFRELRTQAMSVVDYDNQGTPGFLDNESKNLATALESVTLNSDIAAMYVTSTITQILETIDDDQNSSTKSIENSQTREITVTKSTSPAIWTYAVTEGSTSLYAGTVTLPAELPSNISPDNFTTLTASFNGKVPMRKLGTSSGTSEQVFITSMTLTKTTLGADFVLNNTSLRANSELVSIPNASISIGYDYNNSAVEDDKLTMNFVKLNSLAVNGTISGYSINGTLAVPTYVINNTLADKNFFENYNSTTLPKKITYSGDINNTTTSAGLSGALTIDWLNAATMDLTDESNDKPNINISSNGTLKMPTRPAMIVNFGYTNPSGVNNFTFSYSYNTTVINGTGNFDELMQDGTIVLSNHLGLEITIKQTDGNIVYGSQSSVTKGGKQIGELQEREGVPIVKYIDGSFESLP